jgi:hypothetical protein
MRLPPELASVVDVRENFSFENAYGTIYILAGSANSIMSNSTTTSSPAAYLVPAGTTSEGPGHGAPFELGALAGKPLLLILQIDSALEQESLHVSIWGSADGQDWGVQALFWYPQKFYSGVTPAALDLHQRPAIKFLQARWETNRWGRGIPRPHFKFSLELQESAG